MVTTTEKSTKEPWQMTKEATENVEQVKRNLARRKYHRIVSTDYSNLGFDLFDVNQFAMDLGIRPVDLESVLPIKRHDALGSGKGLPIAPTSEELDQAIPKIAKRMQEYKVGQYISQGKPVPAEVLADYPDLAKAITAPEDVTVRAGLEAAPKAIPKRVIRQTTRGFAEDAALRESYASEGFELETVFEKPKWAQQRASELITTQNLTTDDIRLVKHISSPETGEKATWEVYVRTDKGIPTAPSAKPPKVKAEKEVVKAPPQEPTVSVISLEDKRSPHAIRVDQALLAKDIVTRRNRKGVERWRQNPNRVDIKGVDTPSALKARKQPRGPGIIRGDGKIIRQKRGSIVQ